MRRVIGIPTGIITAFALAAATMLSGPATAQEASPTAVIDPEGGGAAEVELHPAHIHAGTCDALGDVVYPLNDLQAAAQVPASASTPPPAGATPSDAEAAIGLVDVVAQSGTAVDVSLDDLVSGEYAINVHASAENMDTYLACGEITGTPENGELFIELRELNTSGFFGEAELSDQGDGSTIVNVSLYPVEVDGTPIATPAG